MEKIKLTGRFIAVSFALVTATSFSGIHNNTAYISYTVNPATTTMQFFWKDDNGELIKSLQALQSFCASHQQQLIFAMNGGMYTEDRTPMGLYIENGKTLHEINTKKGYGNFYLQPNGVLFITKDKKAGITSTASFTNKGDVLYATQSGPMLLLNRQINAAFKKNSTNVNIRNGVGLLPGNTLLFAMSTTEVNLYDFAAYFKNAGCTHALYLDGFVSRTYLPEKNWIQTDGNFGVMIGAFERK